jgi:hypothetical protein
MHLAGQSRGSWTFKPQRQPKRLHVPITVPVIERTRSLTEAFNDRKKGAIAKLADGNVEPLNTRRGLGHLTMESPKILWAPSFSTSVIGIDHLHAQWLSLTRATAIRATQA